MDIPDLGVMRQKEIEHQSELDTMSLEIASMEQEIEIFRRVLALALQGLGGSMQISDDDMNNFSWSKNTLELIRLDEIDSVRVVSVRL